VPDKNSLFRLMGSFEGLRLVKALQAVTLGRESCPVQLASTTARRKQALSAEIQRPHFQDMSLRTYRDSL
jgi:hypothetical protein